MTSPSGPAAVGQDAEGGGAKTPTARTDGHGLGAAGQSPGEAGPGPATARPGLDGPGPTSSRRPATGPAAPRPFDAGPIWARWLPPVLALVLSLWGITTPSYWRDEAATIAAIQRPFGDLITMLGNVDAVHGAYYMLMWPLLHLFGAGEFVLRLPSAIAVAVTAAAVAAIGRRLISPWAGLAAGLVFAVLPVATRYGQEARSYAMVVAMAAIASYLLLRVLGAEPVRRRRWLVAYGASVAALGILNIFGLLLVGAHLVTVVLEYWRRKADPDYRRLAVGWLVAAAAGIVVASPLLVLGWMQKGQIAWLAVNKSSSGPGTLLTLSGSLLVTAAVVAVIAIALVVSAATGKEKAKSGWPAQLAELSLPWLILPPVLLLGASVISPIYTSRYVLMCIPALALIAGAAVTVLGRIVGPVALAIVVLAGLSTQVTQREPYGHYDNIRALDRIVAARAKPGDVVLYTNPNAQSFGAAYPYGLHNLPNIELAQAAIPSGTLAGADLTSLAQIRARLRNISRVWVVEINNPCVPVPQVQALSGKKEGAALTGLPLRFVRMWHERGDYLLLYAHGAGSQDIPTACKPAS